jgi:hypothetical protein
MTIDEARALRALSPRELSDHIYARRDAPGLRPMIYSPKEVSAAARLADGDDSYLEESLPALR